MIELEGPFHRVGGSFFLWLRLLKSLAVSNSKTETRGRSKECSVCWALTTSHVEVQSMQLNFGVVGFWGSRVLGLGFWGFRVLGVFGFC
jgi:hypothetical protein